MKAFMTTTILVVGAYFTHGLRVPPTINPTVLVTFYGAAGAQFEMLVPSDGTPFAISKLSAQFSLGIKLTIQPTN
jgi:hypothetical protein